MLCTLPWRIDMLLHVQGLYKESHMAICMLQQCCVSNDRFQVQDGPQNSIFKVKAPNACTAASLQAVSIKSVALSVTVLIVRHWCVHVVNNIFPCPPAACTLQPLSQHSIQRVPPSKASCCKGGRSLANVSNQYPHLKKETVHR